VIPILSDTAFLLFSDHAAGLWIGIQPIFYPFLFESLLVLTIEETKTTDELCVADFEDLPSDRYKLHLTIRNI